MSIVHPPLPHQPFPDQEVFARPASALDISPVPVGGSSSQTIAMPPPPPPSFPHRHTSPFPDSQLHSFSVLGPPEALAQPPPPAPKPTNTSLPNVQPVAVDRHMPVAFPPTPDLSPPNHKMLFPDAMVKLAPPADDCGDSELEKKVKEVPAEEGIARLPLISLNHLVDDQVPSASVRQRSKSQQLLGEQSVQEPIARGKSASPRPKAPRRSHTAVPSASFRSTAPQGLDVRVRMHSHVSGLPRSNLSSVHPASSAMHRSHTEGMSSPSRFLTVSADQSASEFGSSDGIEGKVVLLGSPGTGKTSLILRYTKKRFIDNHAAATVQGQLYTGKSIQKGVKVKLQIWDTAGQERFRSMAPLYYRGAHVCILLYDISDRESFHDVKEWLEELKNNVGDDTVIYVVGSKADRNAKRAVFPAEARAAIRLWMHPPSAIPPNTNVTPPRLGKKGMFQRSSSTSKQAEETVKSVAPARSHSFDGLTSIDTAKATDLSRLTVPPASAATASANPSPKAISPSLPSAATSTVPFPKSKPTSSLSSRPTSPPPLPVGILRSPTSPTMVTFPPYMPAGSPTSGTTTEHASLISFPPYQKGNGPTPTFRTSEVIDRDYPMTPASTTKSHAGRHAASAGRFSFSGYLNWGRSDTSETSESAGAVSALARLTEENPTSPRFSSPLAEHRRPSDSFARHSTSPSRTAFGHIANSSLLSTSRIDTRRKSEQWTSRTGWRGDDRPSPADLLGEFGEGVKKKQSGEIQSGALSNLPSRVTRSRGGSLGRDSRLHDDQAEGPQGWGTEVDGIRLGECSSLTGEGVEDLFRSISALLAEKKERIEREQTLRKKHSVMLTDPKEPEDAKTQSGYGCCSV